MSEEIGSDPPSGDPEEKPQGWAWTLFTGMSESAVEIWRDGELKLTLPITAGQAELLMGRQVTLTSELERDGFHVGSDGALSVRRDEGCECGSPTCRRGPAPVRPDVDL